MNIKDILKNNHSISNIIKLIFRYFGFNKLNGWQKNSINVNKAYIKRTDIKVTGCNNKVVIGNDTKFFNCHIHIAGNNNKIIIDELCTCRNMFIWIEDDNNECIIGKHCGFMGDDYLILTEGKKIEIGENCLFAHDVVFRTGDSHSILDKNAQRINNAKNISIGNDVWFANASLILKGSVIGNQSIIGANSVVTGKTYPSNVVIAGNPAKIVKENVTWVPERNI